MTLVSSGMLEMGVNIQCLRMIVCGEALNEFDLLSSDMEMIKSLTVEYIIKGLSLYFPPVNLIIKKIAMHRGMNKPCILKVRRYTARLIDLNEYLDFLPGATLSDKIGVTELKVPNIWYKQVYVQGFDCESISFQIYIYMF